MAGATLNAASRYWLAGASAAVMLLSLIGPVHAANQAGNRHEVQLLWPSGAPGSPASFSPEKLRLTERGEHIVSNVHVPSITVYLPTQGKRSGTAVVVIPGGGHRELWMDHEGYRVAEFLADHGIAAFVLKYRLAREPGSLYTEKRRPCRCAASDSPGTQSSGAMATRS